MSEADRQPWPWELSHRPDRADLMLGIAMGALAWSVPHVLDLVLHQAAVARDRVPLDRCDGAKCARCEYVTIARHVATARERYSEWLVSG